jgi:anti-sigma regulatory factor (Ser/Thr protein kinase)
MARAWARVVLSEWNLARLADDGALVLTELITNALLHARGETLHVFLRSDGHRLAIMVGDSSPEMPVRADGLGDDELLFGRGLVIVDSLAQGWAAYSVPTGKIVWALLGP